MAAKKKKKRLFLNHSNITPPNKFINSFINDITSNYFFPCNQLEDIKHKKSGLLSTLN